ncbi:Protease HtpX [Streptomyces sp. ADI97-07]|uniref:M48 family metallopeptidase n=1 Tax=Streptomyces sp. ADI97-07 TaxID=1522762 RepID=UPI000F5587A7|nr:M48 family metallopeptidase [Streptomyces sp. ADI97-07]RPK81406.1 Protease HtpX [Streptomyces sp. ADI97-07]
MPVDSRFAAWCGVCDWNVDPAEPAEEPGRLARVRRTLARRHGERLLAEVSAGGALRPGKDTSALLAHGIALAVHGVTVALVAGGVWCVVGGWGNPVVVVAGLFLVALGWSLRPRLPRLPKDALLLYRADAPALYGLIDEIARVAGTRSVDVIAVDADVNASVTTCGVRGHRLLTLGLPLWETLEHRQRIALLGHELGHYSNGDTRRGAVFGTAYRSLTIWHYYLEPTEDPAPLEMLANLVYLVPRSLVSGLLMLLDQLTLRSKQRAEYLADSVAAQAGSTEAAVELLDRLLVAESVHIALRRESIRLRALPRSAGRSEGRQDGLWEVLAAHVESIPEHEYERQRRVGARRGHSVDDTHPPTDQRRACLLVGAPVPAAVVSDADREQRIAAELADARGQVARQIVRDGVDG